MTLEAQRIAIAQARGLFRIMPLKRTTRKGKDDPAGVVLWYCDEHHGGAATYAEVPDYLSDLNAMHEVEKAGAKLFKSKREREEYWNDLEQWLDALTDGNASFATAAQRTEAFLRTLGLWEE